MLLPWHTEYVIFVVAYYEAYLFGGYKPSLRKGKRQAFCQRTEFVSFK